MVAIICIFTYILLAHGYLVSNWGVAICGGARLFHDTSYNFIWINRQLIKSTGYIISSIPGRRLLVMKRYVGENYNFECKYDSPVISLYTHFTAIFYLDKIDVLQKIMPNNYFLHDNILNAPDFAYAFLEELVNEDLNPLSAQLLGAVVNFSSLTINKVEEKKDKVEEVEDDQNDLSKYDKQFRKMQQNKQVVSNARYDNVNLDFQGSIKKDGQVGELDQARLEKRAKLEGLVFNMQKEEGRQNNREIVRLYSFMFAFASKNDVEIEKLA